MMPGAIVAGLWCAVDAAALTASGAAAPGTGPGFGAHLRRTGPIPQIGAPKAGRNTGKF